MKKRSRRVKRRGILLLLVLSLLVLFVLIGTTFIIVAGHYKSAADAYATHELKGDPPEKQLDAVALELIRGGESYSSPLAHHNLLNDLYGTDGFIGQVTAAAFVGNGQLLEIQFFCPSKVRDPGTGQELPGRHPELNQRSTEFLTPDYYAGSLFTMLSGPVLGQSARIVRYTPPTPVPDQNGDGFGDFANGRIVIDGFENLNPAVLAALRQNPFVVNGRPQSGTGAGFDPSSGDIEATVPINGPWGTLDAELALMPFFQRRVNNLTGLPFNAAFQPYDPSFSLGGLDEPWDAADYQNVFLAMTPDPSLRAVMNSGAVSDIDWLELLPIPSFHRPFLVNYWARRPDAAPVFQLGSVSSIGGGPIPARRFVRSIIGRPLAVDHPQFNGGNVAFTHPGFDPDGNLWHNEFNKDGDAIPDFIDPDVYEADGITPSSTGGDGIPDDFRNVAGQPGPDGLLDMPIVSGPWDVDNDNDGTPDSVWVDLGYPIQSTKDGRLYKPLFAILCVDLDGRLNVNAHGNIDQLEALTTWFKFGGTFSDNRIPTTSVAVNENTVMGEGYGPPEVNLFRALVNAYQFSSIIPPNIQLTAMQTYENLLVQRWWGASINNPPAQINVEAFDSSTGVVPGPGRQTSIDGSSDLPTTDPLSYFKEIGVPADYLNQPNSVFMTPPDLRGRHLTFADRMGQPFRAKAPSAYSKSGNLETVNDPYEANLLSPNAYDHLFSVAELEAVLRFFDSDSPSLNQRLANIVPIPRGGNLLTTRSSSLATSNAVLGPADRVQSLTLTQLLMQELARRNPTLVDSSQPLHASPWLQQQVAAMLPPELRAGRKMNINRPFGDGVDDPTFGIPGIVDDPLEFDTNGDGIVDANDTDGQRVWRDMPAPFGNLPGRFFHPIPDAPDVTGTMHRVPTPIYAPARQIYARHLYCLAMLLLRDFEIPVSDPGMNNLDRERVKARKLAQWAINVVDYRDADSIMTPFEFDLRPFDDGGWSESADGDLTVGGTNVEVVWGTEQPDLLITETVAFHDRGVRDLDTEIPDGGGTAERVENPSDPRMPDEDLDQYKKPQGSLFIELYCPRSPSLGRNDLRHAFSPELYSNRRLDLGRIAPGGYPVWRIGIVRHPNPANSVEAQAANPAQVDTFNFQPQEADFDRFVWFTNIAPSTVIPPAQEKKYYYMTAPGQTLLSPAQFAVVGPRVLTRISSKNDGTGDPGQKVTMPAALPASRILLHEIEGSPVVFRPGVPGEYVSSGPLLIRCGRPSVYSGKENNRDWDIGLNISEPDADTSYYPNPNTPDNEAAQNQFVYMPARDVPLDEHPDGTRFTNGTRPNYATAFLQRLANPAAPFHPVNNPYRTVDWAPIDLHIYNGEGRQDLPEGMAGIEPQPISFLSRERSGNPAPDGVTVDLAKNIWVNRADLAGNRTFRNSGAALQRNFVTPTSDFLPQPLINSLGYINQAFGINAKPGLPGYHPRMAIPTEPYPMLSWPNRPYVSATELMQVPASSSDRLFFDFTLPTEINGQPYVANSSGPPDDKLNFSAPYGHLLNFFHSANQSVDGANLSMLLDYLEVPSRFVGTEKYLNPASSIATPTFSGGVRIDELAVPFNQISLFRDPGRINLNTLNSRHVFSGLHYSSNLISSYEAFRRSRQQGVVDSSIQISDLPTRFANPFRPTSAADLVPLEEMRPKIPGTSDYAPVQATLLRSHPDSANADVPLFSPDEPVNLLNDPNKHAPFRYRHLQRLENLVTQQSNVFAVWITVGYFEVLPWNAADPMNLSANPVPVPDFFHPDGFQLGKELGSDTGQTQRHRAFYIIDRSIPVAFQPGENHNVEDTILLRRLIE